MQKAKHYNCFIAYSHKDHPFIAKIASEVLQEHGLSTFIDVDLKTAHERIPYLKELAAQSDTVLAFASKESVKSDYCISEVSVAQKLFVISLDGSRFKGYFNEVLTPKLDEQKPLKHLHDMAREIKKYLTSGDIESENKILSKRLGNSEIEAQLRNEHVFNVLIIDGCMELKPNAYSWPSVRLEPSETILSFNPVIEDFIAKSRRKYEGPKKFMLTQITGGNSDVPPVSLKGFWIDPQVVIRSEEIVKQAKEYFKSDFKIYNINESQIPNYLVVHSVLVTSDNFLVIGQRSSNVHYFRKHWSCSFEEQINETDDFDIKEIAKRGLKEELLGSEIENIKNDDVVIESIFREYCQTFDDEIKEKVYIANTGVIAIIKSKTLQMQDVWSNWSNWRNKPDRRLKKNVMRPQDRPEFDNVLGVEFHRHVLEDLIMSHVFNPSGITEASLWKPSEFDLDFLNEEKENKWHPSSKLRMICAFRRLLPEDFTDFVNYLRVNPK